MMVQWENTSRHNGLADKVRSKVEMVVCTLALDYGQVSFSFRSILLFVLRTLISRSPHSRTVPSSSRFQSFQAASHLHH
jgi:hypothetical protein